MHNPTYPTHTVHWVIQHTVCDFMYKVLHRTLCDYSHSGGVLHTVCDSVGPRQLVSQVYSSFVYDPCHVCMLTDLSGSVWSRLNKFPKSWMEIQLGRNWNGQEVGKQGNNSLLFDGAFQRSISLKHFWGNLGVFWALQRFMELYRAQGSFTELFGPQGCFTELYESFMELYGAQGSFTELSD